MNHATLTAALEYARAGWYVLPLWWPDPSAPTSTSARGKALGGCACRDPACAAPGKHPIPALVRNGKDDATLDPAHIAGWFSTHPLANIGIATERSGLMVLDVDTGEGKQGAASLATIDAQLTPTMTARTGSGGLHAIYARPAGMAAVTSIGAPGKPLPHLDVIGDGYIVAAPSLHKSGARYVWAAQAPVGILPPVLTALIAERRAHRVEPTAPGEEQPKIGEGGRNAAMFRLGAAVRAQGLDRESVRAVMILENRRRFDPPLPDEEVEHLVGKVMRHSRVERDAAYGAIVSQDMAAMFPEHGAMITGGGVPDIATIHELVPVLEAESKLPVVHLPFQKLDDKIGGLSVHSTTLLVGATGKGKSSLAGQIAVHHAENFGPCVYYVGEMTRSLVVARVAGQRLGRSWIDIVRGHVPWAEIAAALGDLPMVFVKRSDDPVRAIANACERTVALGWKGIPMIVADYVQIMATLGQDARLGVAATVRGLQRFTEDAPVVTLELSQTSRAGAKELRDGVASAEQGQGKGAETSELENGATNTLTISYASKDGATTHDVTILLGKGRFGGGDKFGFIFDGPTGLWTATDRPPVDEGHEQRCAEILSHVMVHEAGKCLGAAGHCGRELGPSAFFTKGEHRVQGTRDQVTRAIEDMIALRRLSKMGQTISTGLTK